MAHQSLFVEAKVGAAHADEVALGERQVLAAPLVKTQDVLEALVLLDQGLDDGSPLALVLARRGQRLEARRARVDELGEERRRNGAFAWGLFEDMTEFGRFQEAYLIESWL